MSPDAWQAWLHNEITDAFFEMLEAEIAQRTDMMLVGVQGRRADELGLQTAYQSGAITALKDAIQKAKEKARRSET